MPLLVMHGTHDKMVPHRLGLQFFAAAHEPKAFVSVEGAGHTDLLSKEHGGMQALVFAVKNLRKKAAASQTRE